MPVGHAQEAVSTEKRRPSSTGFFCARVQIMVYKIEFEQEGDGRWIAEVVELPGALAYGLSPEDVRARVQALALRIVADRIEHGEAGSELLSISFTAA